MEPFNWIEAVRRLGIGQKIRDCAWARGNFCYLGHDGRLAYRVSMGGHTAHRSYTEKEYEEFRLEADMLKPGDRLQRIDGTTWHYIGLHPKNGTVVATCAVTGTIGEFGSHNLALMDLVV